MKHVLPFTIVALLSACTTSHQELIPRVQQPRMQEDSSQPPRLSLSPYEQGINLISTDKSWCDLYQFLHRITSPTNDLPAKLELTEFQQRFIDEYSKRGNIHSSNDLNLLHQIVSEARLKTPPLSRADIIFLGEVHSALRTYVNEGILPKPIYTIEEQGSIHYRIP